MRKIARFLSFAMVFILGMYHQCDVLNMPVPLWKWIVTVLFLFVCLSIWRHNPDDEKGIWKIWVNKKNNLNH